MKNDNVSIIRGDQGGGIIQCAVIHFLHLYAYLEVSDFKIQELITNLQSQIVSFISLLLW